MRQPGAKLRVLFLSLSGLSENLGVSQTPRLDPGRVVSEFALPMLQKVGPRRTWALQGLLGREARPQERVPGVGSPDLSTLTSSGVPGSEADSLWEQPYQVPLIQVLHFAIPLSPE